jgi:hypothetical protein
VNDNRQKTWYDDEGNPQISWYDDGEDRMPPRGWDLYEDEDLYEDYNEKAEAEEKEAEAARQREMAVLRHKRIRAQLESQRESDHYYDEDTRLQADILSGRTQLGRYELDMLGVPPHPSVGLWGKEGMPYNPREFRHLR